VRSVELFAGAGGLALGCSLAGFEPAKLVEWDKWACDTLRQNQPDWDVIGADVRLVDWSTLEGSIDLISAGPPCQPFSVGGRHHMAHDPRDMFPATTEVICKLQPRAFIVENVRGLTRAAFVEYFQFILLRLEHPELAGRDGETWPEHLRRLQREHKAPTKGLRYNLVHTVVNAADYGVPQQRWRLFVVGFRDDISAAWSFPRPSHSRDALVYVQQVTGDYWAKYGMARGEMAASPALMEPETRPWCTVRDVIGTLPEPVVGGSGRHLNHVLQPGARTYPPGHTGSPLDLPAKALKAGVHGVPGGENVLRRPDGSVRYFTVRESARLQTFPDQYEFHGAWGEAMRQLGNAVPVLLARVLADSVADHLRRSS
jgi:DNA (cytosine-5)-methyltransferase 1